MRKTLFLLIGLIFGLAACLGYLSISQTGSAQKSARVQWEYAMIKSAYSLSPAYDKLNRILGLAEICYLQTGGCRRLEIKHEFDYGEFLQERGLPENFNSRRKASLSAAEMAFQKAAAHLGNEGWEIISDPALNFEFVGVDEYNKHENKSNLFERENTKAVYFKRMK